MLFQRFLTAAAIAAIVSSSMAGARADERTAASLGAGMHAFHATDYETAYDRLSEVIDTGTKDPRAYYFRGLAACRAGRGFEADADLMEGARLEAIGGGAWNVGRSLERVQGPDRVKLERYRGKARAMIAAEERATEGRRYGEPVPTATDSMLRPRRPEVEGSPRSRPTAPRSESPMDDRPADAGNVVDEKPAEAPLPAEAPEPAPAGGKENPFGDDPFGGGEPTERTGAVADDSADQADKQAEEKSAESDDALDQKDEQAERESAAGDGGVNVERFE